MRIVSFLFPFPCKYEEAPYLSTLFRQLSAALPETTLHVLGEPYLNWEQFRNRWEFEPWNQWFHEYTIPATTPCHTHVIGQELFLSLQQRFVTPIRAWRHLILERHEPLERAIDEALARATTLFGGVDCVFSWLNVASLRHVCAARGIPIVHNEHGPLRKPAYRHTAYFDRRGVNGQTDVATEYATFAAELGEGFAWPALEQLQNVFLLEPVPVANAAVAPDYPCGVAAQLEEDSNLVAYSNGFTCLELIRHCQQVFGEDGTLVRPHPMAFGLYRGRIDRSPNAATFIRRCGEIRTINSSVAAECLLLGARFVLYGDSPVAVATRPLPGSAVLRESLPAAETPMPACFFFLSYLMPYGMLFDVAYYRWRLAAPTHLQRMIAHLRHYAGLPFAPEAVGAADEEAQFRALLAGFSAPPAAAAVASPAAQDPLMLGPAAMLRTLAELEQERDAVRDELRQTLASRSWRITAPLRRLDALARGRG